MHDVAAAAAMICLPLEFVGLPAVPAEISLMQAAMLVAAAAMLLTTDFRRWILRMDLPTGLFLLGNVTYLGFMAASCHFRSVDVGPGFFLARGGVLMGAVSVALAIRRWGTETRSVSRRRSRRTIAGFSTPMVFIGAIGLIAFQICFLAGLRNVGISPWSLVSDFTAGNKRGYIFSMQMALGSYLYPVPAAIYQGLVPVFKNSVAESIGVIAVLVMVLGGTRRPAGRFVAAAGLAVAVVSLSRSTTIMVLTALILLVPRLRPAVRSMLLVSVIATAMVMGWAYLYSLETAYVDDPVVRRPDASVTSRIDQYSRALFQDRTGNQLLFGRGANHDIGGHRIHNLLLSSWHEGGLIALAAILFQYAAIGWRGIEVIQRGRLGVALAALLVAGVTRTAVAGGGGYYTAAGAVAALTFLLLADHPAFSSRRSISY